MIEDGSIEEIILNLTHAHNFDDYTIEEVVSALEYMDDAYTNDGDVIIQDHEITDKMYDVVYHWLERADPTNVYLTGVGSDVRGGKVKLPYPMPSLNQEQIGDIEDWVKANNLQEELVVITDKMDGTSLMAVYDSDDQFQIAYSRGDGVQGADVSRHYRKMKRAPKTMLQGTMRAEVEMTESNFNILKTKVFKSDGSEYKNARNMMAGIMNSSERPDFVYDYISIIAYTLLDFKDSKIAELNQLAAEGFETPHAQTFLGKELNDEMLADYINARRKDTDYAIDGIVIDVNSAEKRAKMNVGIGTGNPKSSIKYKVADASNTHIATVKSVEWNVSKHGYLKPRVVFEPFDLVGVTIKHATGFNAAFIQSEGIGPGAKVQMTRSGDVIPFIEKVITPATPMMPTEECVWNDTKVDLMLTESTAEVEIQQLIDFCASLNFPHLKEGNVRKLFDAGIDSCEQIVNASMVTLTKVIGTNGIKAYHGIQERLTQVPLFDVMGSVPFFGRGVGKRKFKQLISQIGADYETWSVKAIVKADGFDEITANKIIDGIAEFKQFQINTVDTIVYKGQVVATGELEGEKICMTGFRDQAMSDRIEELGGEVASGVSGKTTILVCTDPDSNSGKAKKAREINEKGKGKITIISVEDFRAQLENY